MIHRLSEHYQLYSGELDDLYAGFFASLKKLSNWENNAVIFVIGYGMGVIVWLFLILTIISYRVLTGETRRHGEQYEYAHVYTWDHDVDFVSTYLADEKVPVVVEKPVQKTQETVAVPGEETK